MWQKLFLVLAEIFDIYKRLLALSATKRSIIVKAERDKLKKIIEQEKEMQAAIKKLESERIAITEAIMAAQNIPAGNKTLAGMLPFCADKALAERFKALQGELKAATEELGEYNDLNNTLISDILKLISYKLNVASQAAVGPTYAPQGREQVLTWKQLDYKA